jgi:UDP-glucose 4-epimerase
VIANRSALKEPFPDVGADLSSFVSCDLVSADWDALLQDGDAVHHYACSTIPKTANDEPLADLEVNVRGTVRLLDALRRRTGIRLVFPSSGGTVYGPLRQTPVSEEHPLDPITIYGVSKVAIEKYLGFYRTMHGLDVRIARLSNPYGVGQDPSRKQGAATIFVNRAMAGQPIEVWGDGSVVRDYIHISDAVAGLLAIVDAPAVSSSEHPVFNIGSGKGVSIREILALLQERLGRVLQVSYLPSRGFDVACNVLDIGRARSVLGWTPRLEFADGMDLTIGDYRAGRTSFSTLSRNEAAKGDRSCP